MCFLNIQVPTDYAGNRALLALGIAKILESVEWAYLWVTLHKFEFGSVFLQWVQLLLAKTRARSRINPPLSPLCFI